MYPSSKNIPLKDPDSNLKLMQEGMRALKKRHQNDMKAMLKTSDRSACHLIKLKAPVYLYDASNGLDRNNTCLIAKNIHIIIHL